MTVRILCGEGLARAVKKGACEIDIVDLRQFGEGRWRKVDDKPYGGGPGMLMMCGPWFAAVEACVGKWGTGNGLPADLSAKACAAAEALAKAGERDPGSS